MQLELLYHRPPYSNDQNRKKSSKKQIWELNPEMTNKKHRKMLDIKNTNPKRPTFGNDIQFEEHYL
jgi:hypothetical protein